MPSYTLSKAAERDLADIAAYTIDTFGIEQALAYRDGLIDCFTFLAEHPKSARLRHELNPPVRARRFQSHLISMMSNPTAASLSCVSAMAVRTGWTVSRSRSPRG
jgi:toxin ParE1/3/4